MLLYLYILYIALKTVSHLFFRNPCFRNLSVGDMLNPRLSLSFFTNHLLCPEAPLIIRAKRVLFCRRNFFSRKKVSSPAALS
ncbi:AVN_HP_G0012590.mRNA.1.CDS.1 [Saccharomyces cerevisiae]|nr:AVN_HP_G0003850.mRNA.1.CDS.1 [Saccharomyces cerevisiae]CAI4959664.1 AVN_HP_G0012590.mRNA.1.CDS.1 [Saccharomyces cerevisiae]CAI6507059.1 AVN_HP_G0003850.mRNA.1.CDS.1 [Saccharomyces cerevisiae]CAI6667257.1 AVN_HP_G0012590.mRNA.1.CDS.1 [Saccharomyces cerevisiae]